MLAGMQVAGEAGLSHEAMLYQGPAALIRQTLPFIREAVRGAQPILVAVDQGKIDGFRAALGVDAGKVRFEDMAKIGRNPARIIPVWRAFVEEHSGNAHGVRGIGEPIWAGRSADELVECERHEALLNLAFDSASVALRLVCPYDTGSLPTSVIDEARRNHPIVSDGGASERSTTYQGLDAIVRPFDAPLPGPPEPLAEMLFDEDHLRELRAFVTAQAFERGMAQTRLSDVVLAVHEAATNSIRYGGGRGVLRIWSQDEKIICEVRDQGLIQQPLVGRVTPDPTQPGGFGLWLANQFCDLVQVRSSRDGSIVRLHVGIA
jgi:anti-sigma regulatory factor (Ser/Thr protein kinase)